MIAAYPAIETPTPPCSINHLVFKVRDIENSHYFWTELIGFRHVGTSTFARADGTPPTRFYSGLKNWQLKHHDFALAEDAVLAPSGQDHPQSLDHIAIEYPSEAAWRERIRFLTERGIVLHRLVERGATHSIHLTDPNGIVVELLFELPREQWADDIEGALNRGVRKPCC